MKRRTVDRVIVMVLVCTASILGSGCGGGPVDITCSQFLTRSESEQLDIVKAWRKKKNLATVASVEDMIVREDRSSMVAYCSAAGHSEDKLTELEYTWG